MHITVQGAQMPWDNVDDWEDGLRSLRYLKRFLLRSWRSLREGNSVEDIFVHQWLILSPPKLRDVIVWTGARQDQGRVAMWEFNDERGVWLKHFEQFIQKTEFDNAPFY
jgi:hypothetical protein